LAALFFAAPAKLPRVAPMARITIIADKYNGKKLNSPNDAVVAADGSIWFCDPAYGICGFTRASRPSPSRKRTGCAATRPGAFGAPWVGAIAMRTACAVTLLRRSAQIHVPETVANLCFGGPQRNRLYICGSSSLYAVYTSVCRAL
jgi:sugar lactone lactonase YvrE